MHLDFQELKDWQYYLYNYCGNEVVTQSPDETRDILLECAKSIHNGLIVEVGVLGGANLLHLHEVCQKNNTRLVGIDPWEKLSVVDGVYSVTGDIREFLWTLRKNLEEIIARGHLNIELIQDISFLAGGGFADKSIDLLFLDGDHSYDAVFGDLNTWYPKIKGRLLGDDYDWKSVQTAIKHYCLIWGLSHRNLNTAIWEIKL